jgi:ribonuclease HI
MIRVWTDGSCRPSNPGPGGWFAVIALGDDDSIQRIIDKDASLIWLDLTDRQKFQLRDNGRLLAAVSTMGGKEPRSTNQRMELTAVIEALKTMRDGTEPVVYTDSAYIVNAFTENWVCAWERRDFEKKANGKPLKNGDLWRELCDLRNKKRARFRHVSAHTGAQDIDSRMNDLCDECASSLAASQNDE